MSATKQDYSTVRMDGENVDSSSVNNWADIASQREFYSLPKNGTNSLPRDQSGIIRSKVVGNQMVSRNNEEDAQISGPQRRRDSSNSFIDVMNVKGIKLSIFKIIPPHDPGLTPSLGDPQRMTTNSVP